MEITCPKCAYTRFVPEGKIPATAEIATCPKCKARFKFRDASGQADASAPQQPAPAPRAAAPDLPREPARRPAPEPRQAPPEASQPSGRPEPPASSPASSASPVSPISMDDRPAAEPAASRADIAPPEPEEAGTGEQTPPSPPQEEPRARQQDDFWDKLETMGSQQQSNAGAYARSGASGAAGSDVPWEQLETYGFFQGMFQTIKQVMLSPIEFFKSMPTRGGISRPLVFYLLISEVVAVFAFVFQMLGMAALTTMGTDGVGGNEIGVLSAMGVGGSALVLILYPLLFTVGLFINAAVTHFFLMIFKAADAGFEGTFRVSAYGNAPIVLAIVPLVGPIVGTIWTLFVLIIGFKYAHRASYGQVIMALLTPLLLLFALGILLAMSIPFLVQG